MTERGTTITRERQSAHLPAHFFWPEHLPVIEYFKQSKLKPLMWDEKCIIVRSPTHASRCLKYVIDPGTHLPLEERTQKVVLQGMKNQKALEDQPGAQKTYSVDNFYEGVVGLLELEWIPGRSLDDVIEKEGPLDADWLHMAVVAAYKTLEVAMERRIMHRDVKPGNMINDVGFNIRFIDWSLAATEEEHNAERRDPEQPWYGTPLYTDFENDQFGVRDKRGLGITVLEGLATPEEKAYLTDCIERPTGGQSCYDRIKNWVDFMFDKVKERMTPEFHTLLGALVYATHSDYKRSLTHSATNPLSDYEQRRADTYRGPTPTMRHGSGARPAASPITR